MANDAKFVTAINCMDGRVQLPVIEFMKKNYQADFVDMITEAGPIKILAEAEDSAAVESIKRRVQASLEKHGSKVVAVIGHGDCAGNPNDKMMQMIQIAGSIGVVESWKLDVKVIGLWVGANWTASEV